MYLFDMSDLEKAKQRLLEEFQLQPHTKSDLLGNAACGRKIRALIIQYILSAKVQSICYDEIKTLMIDSGVVEEQFEKEIAPNIDAYYKAKELIDAGYCNDLIK